MPITDLSSEAARDFARALIDTSQLPLLLLDGEARVVCASGSFYGIFDIGTDSVDGRTLAEIGGGGWGLLPLSLLLENAIANGPLMGDYETDLIRENMRPRRLLVNVRNIIHGAAPDIRVIMAISDVTQVRNAERLNVALLLEKDGLLRQRAELMDEMQHRIANSLQIIASILLLKARAVKSEETRLQLRDAHDRVMSLAAVQQHLQFTLGDVDVAPYLTKLCASLASSMIGEARGLTIEVRSDEAVISSREAVSLGLVTTELVINALKHAFPGGRPGVITTVYERGPEGWRLSVDDDGVGMTPDPPASTGGLGTSIIAGLARQLGADVAISHAAPGMKVTVKTLALETAA
ncbi:MAG: histidine kinase [Caulobacteraceae bacterium]|nr:histidine kinase [Caulobacteraceae bacterium]